MFSDRQLAKIKAGLHADGGGLYIRVSPKGAKSWVVRDRSNGGDKWRTIGRYPRMTLAEARRIAEEKPDTAPALDKAIEMYIAKIKVVRPHQVAWLMKGFPSMTATRQEFVALLQKKAENSPTMANRMLTRWKDFLNFCLQQGWIGDNVIEPVQRRFIGGKENSRDRVLSWEELTAVTDPVLQFILATGLRPSEALWVLKHKRTTGIPGKRTAKDGYTHTLPHSHLIHWMLKQDITIPSSHLTLSNRLRRAGATYRPHDLRRTFATRLSDLGIMPHIIEKLLGHKMQGVMAVYNHAEYWAERHAAQRVWDKRLIALIRAATDAPVPAS